MRTASLDTFGSALAHSSDEGSIVECNVLDERVARATQWRYSPAPGRRGITATGGAGRGTGTVPRGAVGNLQGEPFGRGLPSKTQRPSSGSQQPPLMPLPPSRSPRHGGGFTDAGRDVGFGDSVDGFPMYVDEDGVMKMSKDRRGDPFAFGYDAVEEGDYAMDGGHGDGDGRRNAFLGGDGVARGSSYTSSDGAFVSGSSSSSSLYEGQYRRSQQPGSRVYAHGQRYVNGANTTPWYAYRPLEMRHREVAGFLAAYDDDDAPVPINAALPSHRHVASRRRRLVGAGLNVHATYSANRGQPRRKKGKRAGGGDTGGGQHGERAAKANSSPRAPTSRRGGRRAVHRLGRRPTRLSCSGSLPLSTNPSLTVAGGGSCATTASPTVVTSVPGGLSGLLSASVPVDLRSSESEKTARVREYLLARQAVAERRYAALRRGSTGIASTAKAVGCDGGARGLVAAADTLYAATSSSTGNNGGPAATSGDGLAIQYTRGAWPLTPLSMSLNDLNQSMRLNTGRALASAAARSARLRVKDAPTQLQALVTKDEAVYVRADPTSAAAASEARGSNSKAVADSDGSPDATHATAPTTGMLTHAKDHMATLHDPCTGLTIGPAYAPPTKAAAAVHTCFAGIHFFRDPTAPRPSEPVLQASIFSAMPGTPSRALPAACLAWSENAPLTCMHAGAAAVPDDGSRRSPFSASPALTARCTASSASAAYWEPASLTPAAQQRQPWVPPLNGLAGEDTSQSRSPSAPLMYGPSSAMSLLPDQRQSRDGMASAARAQLGWRTPKTATFRDARPDLTARGESVDAVALPTVPRSGSGGTVPLGEGRLRGEDQSTIASLKFGDDARLWWKRQTGATPPSGGADAEGGADRLPWRWRCGASALGVGNEEGQRTVPIAAASKDEAARGWPGAYSATFHQRSAAGEDGVSRSAAGASSSARPTRASSFAWPCIASPQLPTLAVPIAPCAAPRHPQHNTRYHAWIAEGVSATSSTSCMVHVFAVSKAMLRSVYEYVAYMCVARQYAEVQRRRKKRGEHLIKEVAAGRLTRKAQRCLRCPHCGIVGQVVRGSSSQRDGQTLKSNSLASSTLAQSQHEHGAKHHHHHHSPHHSPASHHPSLASTTTTTTTTASTTPRQALFLRGCASAVDMTVDLSSQQQHMERSGRPSVIPPTPRWTSLPPHPPPRSAFGMENASQSIGHVATDDSGGKTDERQSELRTSALDEVNMALAAAPESAVPLSPPAAPAARTAHAPSTRSGSAASGSLTALPPLARSTSLPPLRPPPQQLLHEEDYSSQECWHCRSTSLSQLPRVGTVVSTSPLPSPPPLLIPAAATTAPPLLARLHASPHASSVQGAHVAGAKRSSDAGVETLQDSPVVSGGPAQPHYLSLSPHEISTPGTLDRYTGASSSDFSLQRQQPPATESARPADEARQLDKPASDASPRKTAEKCGGVSREDAAAQRSSLRTTFAIDNSHIRSLRASGFDSDAENGRLGQAGTKAFQVPEPTASQRWSSTDECFTDTSMLSPSSPLSIPVATLLDSSTLMAVTGTHDSTVPRMAAAAQPTPAASADSSASWCAPSASTTAATTTMTAVITAFNAQVRAIGSSSKSNLNISSASGSNSLVCSMVGPTSTSVVPPLARLSTPLQSEEDEKDEDEGAVVQRCRRDRESCEAARDCSRSGRALYVCLGCHQSVIPKPSFLTSVGGHRSSSRHSRLAHHPSDTRQSSNITSISGNGGDAHVEDSRTEEAANANIGVMAFDDLLQDDTFVYALHTALCGALMMPPTREPPPLPPPPHKGRWEGSAGTLLAAADLNDLPSTLLPAAPALQSGAPSQPSPKIVPAAAADAAGKTCSGTAASESAPPCRSSRELHEHISVAMRGGSEDSPEGTGGAISELPGELAPPQQCDALLSPLSISAAPSPASTSSLSASLESYSAPADTTPAVSNGGAALAASREGGGRLAAPPPTRFLLPCYGLKVCVLPYEEPQERTIDVGSMRRGSIARHLLRLSSSSSKRTSSACLSRRLSSTSASLSRPAMPRMREDAATRGLTPSAMIMSDAAASNRRTENGSKRLHRLGSHRDTPPRQRRRRSLMSTAAAKLSHLGSPRSSPMMHNEAAWTALMMKGTFSSEKHRIQVNPRTPLDAVSKNRIMQRIFRQDRLHSLGDAAAAHTQALSRPHTAVGPASRVEDHTSVDLGSLASPAAAVAAPAAASTAVAAPRARRQRRVSAANGHGDAAAAAAGRPASTRGSDIQGHRCLHHHAYSSMREQAQQQAQLLVPPKRSPKPLALDLGAYRDSSPVLEIDVAYPRLPRGNVRELLSEWKSAYQPHPVLVETVIRNIVYAVLVQLSALHAAGRTHGSVKSTNIFPLWHAMEGARSSGIMMPPRPRPRAAAHGKPEAGLEQEKLREAEAIKAKGEEEERQWSASNPDKGGFIEPSGTQTVASPVKDEAVAAGKGHTPGVLASPSATAALNKTLRSPTRRRCHSGRRRRCGAPHASAVHLRPHSQTRSRHRQTPSPSKGTRGTGASSAAKSSASVAPSGASLTSAVGAPSTGLATAMAAYRRSVSVSVGGGAATHSKQDDASSIPRVPTVQSAVWLMPSSPSAVLLSAAMQTSLADGNEKSASTFSPMIGPTCKNARVRRRGGTAARLRRCSIGTNVVGDDLCGLNDAADSEDDSGLVPLVAEVMAPPSADPVPRAAATKRATATAESKAKPQRGSWETPTMTFTSSFASLAAVPRHRDRRHGHHRSPRERGSRLTAVEDPEEWLAAAAPRRYVCGVELRPPAAVLFPRMAVGRAALAGDTPGVDHGGTPSADAAAVLESVSDTAAQPVLTRGPVGAVPHPRLDNGLREEASAPAAAAPDWTRRRTTPAGPSTSSSATLHGGSSGAGQGAPDPLQWSRQVLLVENVGAVVATALRTAMACVLMRHPPRPHASPLPPPSVSLKSARTTPMSRPYKAHHAEDGVASPTAAATSALRKSGAAAARALNVHIPDVVHSPPPLPPNLFAIQESEYVPAPEQIRFPADEACVLRRLWCQQPGDAAAVSEVKEGEDARRHPESSHNPTVTAADAETEVAAQVREILARLEAVASPAMTLLNTRDPYPASSAAVDIWELGMMALELADGPPQTAWLKQREPMPALHTYPWSSYFHAFVSLCLQRAPEQRGTAAELLQHPWFSVALIPQASSGLSPRCSLSKSVGCRQAKVGSGAAAVPVAARNVETARQSGEIEGLAPVSSSAVPLWPARSPAVMGVDCLTTEEKAEWENYDYTLLYASGVQLTRSHTTAAAAANAAEERHQSGTSTVRRESASAHEAQGPTASATAAAAGMRDNCAAGTTHAVEMPSLLGLRWLTAGAPSLLNAVATAAVAMPSQSSILAAPSAGGHAAVALPSAAAAVAASATTASANEELMAAMCAVDLAQSFAEIIMEQWVQQQKQLVPSLATAAGACEGAAKGMQAMPLPARTISNPAAATSPPEGTSSFLLSAASNALSSHSAPPAPGHGAVPQAQPPLFFSQPSCEEKMPAMWRGHSVPFGSAASLWGQMAAAPVVSSRVASSPSPSPPSDFASGGAVRVLPTSMHTLHESLRDPRVDPAPTAANASVSPWGESLMSGVKGAAGNQSQLHPQQAPSSATHGMWLPWFQRSGPAAPGDSTLFVHPTLQRLACWDDGASGDEGSRSKVHWYRSNLDDGGGKRGGDWDSSGNSPHDGRHTRAASSISSRSSSSSSTQSDSDSFGTSNGRPGATRGGGHGYDSDDSLFYVQSPNVGGEVPVPTRTSGNYHIDNFSTAARPFIVDATDCDTIVKVVAPGQGTDGGHMALDDTATCGGAAAPKLRQRGGDGRWVQYGQHAAFAAGGGESDYGAALRPSSSSSSRPTHHMLIGTIATALARLSMMTHLLSDSDGNGDEATSGSSSSSDGEDSSSNYSDGSDGDALSSKWGASLCRSTPLALGENVACTRGCGDGSDTSSCEASDGDDDGQSMSADVRCDELLRCLSALQRRCPAAIGLWCVRVLQQAMRYPPTAASAERILERIESILPAELGKNRRWFKRPSTSLPLWRSPAPSASCDVLPASGGQRDERTAATCGDGDSSLFAVAAVARLPYAAGGAFPPAELDASPSSFHNYEMAKWAYALRQAVSRCT
ncbi:hypothetical protein LSCM1_04225 [Leishmania martiniquensis]|uniref:Uncharacterized protein n=1 Tax=Leishmania martiniquensis TaxID=1580590 RepID=A0A836KKP7_9TRYP|nr:hypothetical protein LSCM1_04225 [Leishmania martiniquensis]